jgi:predicted N-formylglutamate amidohydrolase
VEIRQDHCETREELMRWADILGDALERILEMDNLHKIELF